MQVARARQHIIMALLRRETSDLRDRTMEALLRLSSPWGHRLKVNCGSGLVDGGLPVWLPRCLTRWRRRLFGNDDASNGVWVMVGASVVGLRRVRWILSCIAMLLWSRSCGGVCPCGNAGGR
jgi:hypothetical protein